MRYIYVLLLLFFSSCSMKCDIVEAVNPKIAYEGRHFTTDKGSVRYDYPGFCIKASFEGSKISAKFKPNSGYYMVKVDDLPEFKLSTETGDSLFVIADNLEGGRHEVSLTLVSEGIFCQPEFFGFELYGSLLPNKKSERKKIEFIGNSITCGYGVEASKADDSFNDSTSNFLKSYAGLLASSLDAEVSVVARSGIGIHRNYNEPVNNHGETMPMVYGRAAISEKDRLWDFSFVPELVCINLGTNDLSTDGYDLDVMRKEYSEFFSVVRGKYPNAAIVLLSGCMLGEKEALILTDLQKQIVEEARRAGDDKVHQFSFTPQDGSLGYGADWHPSELQQKKMAAELLPFIHSLNLWSQEIKPLSSAEGCERYCDVFLCMSEFIEDSCVMTPDLYAIAESTMNRYGYKTKAADKNKIRLYPKISTREHSELQIDCDDLQKKYAKFEEFEVKSDDDSELYSVEVFPYISFYEPKFDDDAIFATATINVQDNLHLVLRMDFKIVVKDGKYHIESCKRQTKF